MVQRTIVILILAVIIPFGASTSVKYSSFWERKIITLYMLVDADGDGVVTMNDFDLFNDCMIQTGNLNVADAEDFREAYNKVYTNFYQANGGPCTLKQCLQYREQKPLTTESKINLDLSPRVFAALDSNEDGQLDEAEFSVFFICRGSTVEMARFAFQNVDTDHDGKISEDQYISTGNDFFTLQTEGDPSQYMFGQLVPATSSQDEDDLI